MKKLILGFLIISLIWACSNTESNKGATQSDSTASAEPAKVDGKKLYKQYCVTCHGLYGDMGASGAANLAQSQLGLEERIEVLTNGREGTTMQAFKSLLNEEKIKAISEYTMTLTEDAE